MFHASVQTSATYRQFGDGGETQPAYELRLRPRVVLESGTVAALDVLGTRASSGGMLDLHPRSPLHGALGRWPASVSVGIPVAARTQAGWDGLRILLRAQRDRIFGSRQLELLLPASLVDAGPDALLILSDLLDEGVTAVLDCSGAALPPAAALDRMPVSGIMVDAGQVMPSVPGKGVAPQFRTILRSCAELGLAVFASNIETDTQRAVLGALGCSQGSGDLFGQWPRSSQTYPLH